VSHFSVLVLVEDEPSDPKSAVEPVLAPYDDNREVEEYERQCSCLGRHAHYDAVCIANERTGFSARVESTREVFREYNGRVQAASGNEGSGWSMDGPDIALVERADLRAGFEAEKAALDEQWSAIFSERDAIADETERADPRYRQPDPECDDCHGTGRERTTANPQGFWDWWAVGGRWAGVLDPEYDASADPRNFSTCWLCYGTGERDDELGRRARAADPSYGCNGCKGTGVSRNWHNADFPGDVKPVAQLPESLPFYALVTPDGQWHQRGRMGWFGMSADDMDDATWDAYLRTEIAKHADAWAVVVDCHV
jgi:hypothetical protein